MFVIKSPTGTSYTCDEETKDQVFRDFVVAYNHNLRKGWEKEPILNHFLPAFVDQEGNIFPCAGSDKNHIAKCIIDQNKDAKITNVEGHEIQYLIRAGYAVVDAEGVSTLTYPSNAQHAAAKLLGSTLNNSTFKSCVLRAQIRYQA